jgi:hypothetical protein
MLQVLWPTTFLMVPWASRSFRALRAREPVGLDILVETLLEGLVEDDGVDGLVLHCSRKSTLALGLLVAGSLGAGVSWMGEWMRACAFRRSFMCVVDARRGWGRDFAYPCPWTTSSFVFRREAF